MILKSGTKFRIRNIKPIWEEMIVPKDSWGFLDTILYEDKLWVYDEEYCNGRELVEMSWTSKYDRDIKDLYNDFVGVCYDGIFYRDYGLVVKPTISIEPITEDEFVKILKRPINLNQLKSNEYNSVDLGGLK